MHYFQFHIGDYRSATSHLSNEEDLAYRRLLDMYYDTESCIPLDTEWVSRRLRVDKQVVSVVLKDMFVETPNGWFHARCDAGIKDYHALVNRNRTNGKAGGRPRRNPDETQSVATGKVTINHKPITNKDITSADADFEKFWEVWPSSQRKVAKQKCLAIWKQKKLSQKTDQIIAHVKSLKSTKQWTDGFEPAPLTYLNQGRYDDGIPDAANETKAMGVKIL
jgi:uncharacterized protein YdaU (DUF1376 family)